MDCYKVPATVAKVLKAVIKNAEQLYRFADQVAAKLDGHPYQIDVHPFKRDRTLGQNAKVHALIRSLALHCGYTESAMKEILKAEYSPRIVRMIGTRMVDVPKGTSEMNVEEMSDFVEQLYQLGSEINCVFVDEPA